MKFQTTIPLEKQPRNLIDYNSNILLLGSCFSENIGDKLAYFKLQNCQNPFGILFHPKAIEQFITDVSNTKTFTKDDLIYVNERYHSFDAHSSLSNVDEHIVLNNLNSQIKSTAKFLKNTSHVLITLGTAWVYRFIEKNRIVANCHKIPQKKFQKEILSIQEITESLATIVALIKKINPKITLLFTVSPIRHLKDGFVENTQSKSHLISAIHTIIKSKKNTHYFPSFEIMMDELRDYRFYKEDMVHPNATAINYIWERFMYAWVSEKIYPILKEIDTIQKASLHKPFYPKSEAHQKFLKNIAQKKEEIKKKLPFVNF